MSAAKEKTGGGWWLVGGVFLLLVLAVVSLLTGGDGDFSWEQLWQGLTGRDELMANVLWNMRLPSILVAALTGAALSASGLVMQAYFRNGLASPGLLGVSSGGTAGAVVTIGLGWASTSLWMMPAASIVGAFLATAMVLSLAKNGTSTERLLLAGIALNALLGAVTSYVLSNATVTYERNAQILFWLMGGLEDRTWEHVWMALPILLGLALLWPLGRPMDLLSLGAAEAQSLGVDVRRVQRWLIVLSTLLTALSTAVVGTVGFVGLVVPHILRLLVGAEHRRLVPVAIVGGAVFMLACDLLGHQFGLAMTAWTGRQVGGLRIGIVTAAIGAPFFLWLLRRK